MVGPGVTSASKVRSLSRWSGRSGGAAATTRRTYSSIADESVSDMNPTVPVNLTSAIVVFAGQGHTAASSATRPSERSFGEPLSSSVENAYYGRREPVFR